MAASRFGKFVLGADQLAAQNYNNNINNLIEHPNSAKAINFVEDQAQKLYPPRSSGTWTGPQKPYETYPQQPEYKVFPQTPNNRQENKIWDHENPVVDFIPQTSNPMDTPHYFKKAWGDPGYLDLRNPHPYAYEMQYGGHFTLIEDDRRMTAYFSEQNVNTIGETVTRLLMGVHPKGQTVAVPPETIKSVMSAIYTNRPGNLQDMTDMVVDTIVTQIRNEFEIIGQNNDLSAWVMKYDGDYGVVQYPKIKIRNKHPKHFVFNMNY